MLLLSKKMEIEDDKVKEYKVKSYKNSEGGLMGVTIKGKGPKFEKAHEDIGKMMKLGREYKSNSEKIKVIEHSVMRNMTVSIIEVTSENSEVSKAELKVYKISDNKKRGATLEIRQESNSTFEDVEVVKKIIT